MSNTGFVLDGADNTVLNFHDIRSPGKPQRFRPQRNRPQYVASPFLPMATAVDPTVRTLATDRVLVVAPHAIAVNERALACAVHKMFNGRD